MGIGASMKRWAHGKQQVAQIFNPDPRFARLAVEALRWCLLDRGIELTDDIVGQVRAETEKYPNLTVKEFIEAIMNKKMQSHLSDI